MKNLEGGHAIVTGASKGIGVDIARALAAEGVNLILAARTRDQLEKVCEEISQTHGVEAVSVPTDMAKPSDIKNLAAVAREQSSEIDIIVHNAGVDMQANFEMLSWDKHDSLIRINLVGPLHLTHLFHADMIKRNRGHIVNIASLAGLGGGACLDSYSATKHGLVGFTRAIRASSQFSGSAVSSSVICPGYVRDAGMMVEVMRGDYGPDAIPGWLLGSVTSRQVARATVRAIKKDLPLVVVSPGVPRLVFAIGMLFPSFMEWFFMKVKAHDAQAAIASKNNLARKP